MSLTGSLARPLVNSIVGSLLAIDEIGFSISLSAPDFGGNTYYEGVDDNDVVITLSNFTPGAAYSLNINSSGGGIPVTASGTIDGSGNASETVNLTPLNAGNITVSAEEASVEVATKVAVIAQQAAPNAPTITGVVWASEAATVTISPGSANGAAITDHIWEYNEDGGGWTAFNAGTSTGTTGTTPELTKGADVDFRVRSANSIGTGANGTDSSTVPATVPDQVGVVSTASGDGQVTLSWSAPDDGGSPITDYIAQYKLSSSSAWITFPDGVSATTGAVITGLTNANAYDFQVAARNAIGDGGFSVSVSETPNDLATFSDDFNRANENVSDGANWTLLFGGSSKIRVNSNLAQSFGGPISAVTCPIASANAAVEADFATISGGFGIAARMSDANNYLYVETTTGGDQWRLLKHVGGTTTLIGSYSGVLAVNDRARLEVSGDNARVLADSVEVIGWTSLGGDLAGNTGVGLRALSASKQFDNFYASEL